PAHGRALPPLLGRVGEPRTRSGANRGGEVGGQDAGAAPDSPTLIASRSVPPQKGRERAPDIIEPTRRHRIAHDREALAARIDLHGMTWDAAHAALHRFIARAYDQGWRAVLVITGKGALGDGVLRRHVPDWIAEPPIRPMVAG